MSTRSHARFVRGALLQVSGYAASLLVYPVVARVLDAEGLGAWALLSSAGFVVGLADIGLSTAVQRAAVTPDHPRARRMVSLSLLAQTLLLPPFVVLAGFAVLVVPDHAGAPADVASAAAIVFGSSIFLSTSQPYRMFVLARGGADSIGIARTLGAVVQIAVLFAGFTVVRTLLVPAVALLCGYAVEWAWVVRRARRIDPEIPLRPRWPADWREARAALRDGAAALAINAAIVMALRIDLFVLAAVAPLAVVAAYGVAGRAIDLAYLLAKQPTVTLLPEIGDPRHRADAVRRGTIVFGVVVGSGMAALASCGQPLLGLWVGDVALHPIVPAVLALLGAAAVVIATYEVAGAMLTVAAPTAWACAVPIVAGTAVKLAISLGGASSIGAIALASGTLIGNLITMVWLWRRARALLGWGPGAVAVVLAAPAGSAAVAAGIGLAVSGWAEHGIVASLAAPAISGLSGLITGVVAMGFWWRRLFVPVAAGRAASGA